MFRIQQLAVLNLSRRNDLNYQCDYNGTFYYTAHYLDKATLNYQIANSTTLHQLSSQLQFNLKEFFDFFAWFSAMLLGLGRCSTKKSNSLCYFDMSDRELLSQTCSSANSSVTSKRISIPRRLTGLIDFYFFFVFARALKLVFHRVRWTDSKMEWKDSGVSWKFARIYFKTWFDLCSAFFRH